MRIEIQLSRTHDDRVEGEVTGALGEQAQAFSGWLELLHLLDAAVPALTPTDRPF